MKLNYEPKQIYDVSKGQELFKKRSNTSPRAFTVTSVPPKAV